MKDDCVCVWTWSEWKILSTPMARTRKGITSEMISVACELSERNMHFFHEREREIYMKCGP